MNKTSLLFDKIGELSLDYHYGVNQGGCGCFALMMHEILPHLNIVYMNSMGDIDLDNYDSCGHAMLSDGEFYYDAGGTFLMDDVEDKYHVQQTVEREYVEKSLEDVWQWNRVFDRRDLRVIARKITKVYEAFNKEQDERPKSKSRKIKIPIQLRLFK